MTYKEKLQRLHKEYNNGYLTYDQLVEAKKKLDAEHSNKA
jgi:hypothetical protein